MKFSFLLLFICAISISLNAQDLIPVKLGKYWGYSDFKGNIVINPIYLEAYRFSNGMAVVKDRSSLSKLGFGRYLYGYIDTKGIYVIRPNYLYASEFESNYAIVYKDYDSSNPKSSSFIYNNHGQGYDQTYPIGYVIDKNEKVIFKDVEKGYSISPFFKHGISFAKFLAEKDKYFFVNIKGEKIEKINKSRQFAPPSEIYDDYIRVTDKKKKATIFINLDGVEIPNPENKSEKNFVSNGFSYEVTKINENLSYIRRYEEKSNITYVGIINKNYKVIIDPNSQNEFKIFSKDLIFVKEKNRLLYKGIDSNGEQILPYKFDGVNIDFHESIK